MIPRAAGDPARPFVRGRPRAPAAAGVVRSPAGGGLRFRGARAGARHRGAGAARPRPAAWNRGHASLLAARLLDGPHGLRLDDRLPRAPSRWPSRVRWSRCARAASTRIGWIGRVPREDGRGSRSPARPGGDCIARTSRRSRRASRTPRPSWRRRPATPRDARWLADAEVLIVDDLELDPAERTFVAALARAVTVRRLAHGGPPRRSRPRASRPGRTRRASRPSPGRTRCSSALAPPPARRASNA